MANKAKATKVPVFDVSKPGKTAPAATSRPVIVTNRPVLKDPMMVRDDENVSADDLLQPAQPQAITATKIKIQPLTPAEPAVKKAVGTKPADPAPSTPVSEEPPVGSGNGSTEPDAELAALETIAAPELTMADTPATIASTAPAGSADVSEPETASLEPAARPHTDSEEEQQQKELNRLTELEKLTEDRTYYLPINQVEKRKNFRYAIAGLLLIILLGVAWANIALDAGILTIPGVKPVTHFFGD